MIRVWPSEAAASTAAGQAILGNLRPRPASAAARPPVEIGLAQALCYSVHRGETRQQPSTVAAAICDDGGFPAAAISVAFEGNAVPGERLHEAGRVIAESARRAAGFGQTP